MRYIIILSLIVVHFLCHGEESPQTQQALKETQDFLKNKKERDAWVVKDQRAFDADRKAEALAGKDGKEDMYLMSAELMEKITKETGGDPEKMRQLVFEAQQNPQEFYNKYFSEAQKAKVRDMAGKIEKNKPANAPPK